MKTNIEERGLVTYIKMTPESAEEAARIVRMGTRGQAERVITTVLVNEAGELSMNTEHYHGPDAPQMWAKIGS